MKLMQKKIGLLTLFILLPLVGCFAQPTSTKLENIRVAKGNTLVSDSLPKLKLTFGKDFKYAGGHTFILYDVARAEQHFYVDADKDGRISRLYWVQFEGYLPENKHKYDYSKSQRKVTIDGLEFYADTWARKNDPTRARPNSDGSKAQEFLKSKGFIFKSDEFIMQRLVNMVDQSNRDELMVIYLEVLPDGSTAADLNPNGKDAAKWPEVSNGLLARAKQNMKIEM
ncbi:MAG TPA: hypothetical protein VJL58_07830 [Pyrinomonadaceae bacterium]|nr:hypothetical protein [Pyrinomonadaceae bacterium]